MSSRSNLLDKNWFLVSYNNLDTHLVAGLRLNRLNKYLIDREVRSKLVTRKPGVGHDTISIKESSIIKHHPRWSNAICIPDASALWAVKVFRHLRKKEQGVILTTMPPYGVCLTGILAKLFTRHYWIADFRDPWILNPVYKPVLYWYKKVFAKALEWIVFRYSDLIILNTNRDRDSYLKKYPRIKNKSIVVRNGFDEVVTNKARVQEENEIRIVYSGSAYHRGVAAINIVHFFNKINLSNTRFVCDYYGEYHPSIELSEFVNYKGLVSQKQIPNILSNYKMGIIYLQEECIGGGRITQKFYDYLGSGVTPIVMNPSREMSDGMEKLDFGVEVYPDSGIGEIVENIKANYSKRPPNVPREKIQEYTRSYQFGELIDYLEVNS